MSSGIPGALLDALKRDTQPAGGSAGRGRDGPAAHSRRQRVGFDPEISEALGLGNPTANPTANPNANPDGASNANTSNNANTGQGDNYTTAAASTAPTAVKSIVAARQGTGDGSPEFQANLIKDRFERLSRSGREAKDGKEAGLKEKAGKRNGAANFGTARESSLNTGFQADELRAVAGGLLSDAEAREITEQMSANIGTGGNHAAARKEVLLLRNAMDAMLNRLGVSPAADYPGEVHTLLAVIAEEQRVYDMVFRELIRQVTVHMHERGQILADVRERYARMFAKVPRQVRSLHTELLAQRKLNRHLSEELLRVKDSLSLLLRELDIVKRHDAEVTRQAQDAQQRLIATLTQGDAADDVLEEYHRLYRLQRDRLAEQAQAHEAQRRMWRDAATNLALRIGREHNLNEVAELHRWEQTRLRAANHVIVALAQRNEAELQELERRVATWRARLLRVSHAVSDDDQASVAALMQLQRELKALVSALTSSSNNSDADYVTDFPALADFQSADVQRVSEALHAWTQRITSITLRFTSDRDMGYRDELRQVRLATDTWTEAAGRLFARLEKSSTFREYEASKGAVPQLTAEIDRWLKRLDLRIAGEDGIASLVISLQNIIEDK